MGSLGSVMMAAVLVAMQRLAEMNKKKHQQQETCGKALCVYGRGPIHGANVTTKFYFATWLQNKYVLILVLPFLHH
jgi:hypothetical protein